MNRAIIVAIVAALMAFFIVGCGQGSEPRRPAAETKRDPPGKVEGSGYKPGTQPQPQPENPPPTGK